MSKASPAAELVSVRGICGVVALVLLLAGFVVLVGAAFPEMVRDLEEGRVRAVGSGLRSGGASQSASPREHRSGVAAVSAYGELREARSDVPVEAARQIIAALEYDHALAPDCGTVRLYLWLELIEVGPEAKPAIEDAIVAGSPLQKLLASARDEIDGRER